MAFARRNSRFLKRRKFSPGERSAAALKLESLKDARAVLQPLAVSLETIPTEKKAVLNAMLVKKNVRRPISTLVAQSIMLLENLRAASQGRKAKHDISPIEEGQLIIEMKVAVKVVNQAKEIGII